MFDSKEDAYKIPEYLNGRHHSIKFTIEEEKDGNLPFLDVLISKLEGGTFHTTTYRKPTNTGLLTNFTSFCSYSFKIGLIKTLVDRAYKINSDLLSCTHDHNFISTVLQKNLFPLVLIKRVMNDYMARVPSTNSTEDMNPDVETPVIDKRFYKLPYLGEVSPKTNRALIHLIKRCCLLLLFLVQISGPRLTGICLISSINEFDSTIEHNRYQKNTTGATLVDFFFYLLLINIFFVRDLEFHKLSLKEFPTHFRFRDHHVYGEITSTL